MSEALPAAESTGGSFRVGIMQGRLSPPRPGSPQYFPRDRWEIEFGLAAEIGFDAIEWLFSLDSEADNPILSPGGRRAITQVARDSGVRVETICADYFKNRSPGSPDASARERASVMLDRVIEAAAEIDAARVLIPLLEEASMSEPALVESAKQGLARGLKLAANRGVQLALETDLPAADVARILRDIDHSALGVYYDLGNAVALGYDPLQEIRLLAPWIMGVHVKDRTFQGPNVPLGEGNVDFVACLEALEQAGYTGLLVLETVRGSEYETDARRNRQFVTDALARVGQRRPR